jgi:hypothetical protein
MDCGLNSQEIEHARAGVHAYAEYQIFGELSLILCNFCAHDFSSYDPTFFGLPRGARLGMAESRSWTFVRDVQPCVVKDKCCNHCHYRLPFLQFVLLAREINSRREIPTRRDSIDENELS